MNVERPFELVESDPEAGVYRATYNYPDAPPSIAVPLAIMEVTETEVTSLDPMYDAANVNPDALDDLFDPTATNPVSIENSGDDCHVTFTYHGFTITVKDYGRIVIRSPAADRGSGNSRN